MPTPIDLLLAVRFLRRRWVSSLAVAGTLAVGLAVTAGLFVIADGVLMRDFPVREPDRLLVVGPRSPFGLNGPSTLRADQVEQLAELAGVVSAAGYCDGPGFFGSRFQEAESLRATSVTPRFFQTLGITAQVGRVLIPEDAEAPDPRPVVISDGLWDVRYGRAGDVLGKAVVLGGRPVRVLGVAPPGFDLPRGTNVWVPDPAHSSSGFQMYYLQGIVRVDRMPSLQLPGPPSVPLLAMPLREYFRPSGAEAIVALFIATALTLLIGWVHLAALQTAQAGDAWRDLTLRAALGAGQRRLALCWLFQTFLLSAGGTLVAFAALDPTVRLFAHLLPPEVTLGQPITVDHQVILYLGVLTVAGSLFLASGPLLLLRRQDLTSGLRGRIPIVGGLSYSRLRSVMLAAQVALVSTLLYLAGLTVHGLVETTGLDIGIDTEHVMGVTLPTDARRFGSADFELIRQRLRRLPFVTEVARGNVPLLGGKAVVSVLPHAPRRLDEMQDRNGVEWYVSRGYFRAVGARVLAGSDEQLARPGQVVVLSRRLSSLMGFSGSPVGRTVYVNGMRRAVVGLVSDVWGNGPGAPAPTPYLYSPDGDDVTSVILRTSDPAAARVGIVTQVVGETLGVRGPIGTVLAADRYARTTAPARSRATLLVLLSLSSFLLGAVGVFCMTSENVRRGAREAAVRAALGAPSRVLVGGVVMASVRRVGLGAVVGLGLGISTAKLATVLVPGLRPFDTMAAVAVAALMLGAGVVAALIPARSAGRANLLELLREE